MTSEEIEDFVRDFMVDHFWIRFEDRKGLVWNWDPRKRAARPGGIAGLPGVVEHLCGFVRYFTKALGSEAVAEVKRRQRFGELPANDLLGDRRHPHDVWDGNREWVVDAPEDCEVSADENIVWKDIAEMCLRLLTSPDDGPLPELTDKERKMLLLTEDCLRCPVLAGSREVLLRRAQGKEFEDTADELGTTPVNARMRWSRGLRTLASCLRARWSGGPPPNPRCFPDPTRA